MPLLVISEPRQPERRFDLGPDDVIIGRSSESDLCLPNVSVSRRHARLRVKRGGVSVEDLGSNNGTELNGEEIQGRRTLSSGDTLRVGKYTLVYLIEVDMSPTRALQVEEMAPYQPMLGASTAHSTHVISAALRKKLVEAEKRCQNAVLVQANDPTRRWRPGADEVTIGPGGKIPVSIFMARTPVAKLQWNGNGHVVHKTGMLGKVLINGNKPQEGRILDHGDEITVGKLKLKYEVREKR